MQFIAMEMTCRISNPFINEQNVAALADTGVRWHGFCELDKQVGCSKEHPTAQLEIFLEPQ